MSIETSLAHKTNFIFVMDRLPNVQFFLQDLQIPSVSVSTIIQQTDRIDYPEIGDKIEFQPLSLSFLIDENFENYLEVFEWMTSLRDPNGKERVEQKDAVSDATLTILNNNKVPIANVKFIDCFPSDLDGAAFDVSAEGTDQQIGNLTLAYTYFTIDLIENPVSELIRSTLNDLDAYTPPPKPRPISPTAGFSHSVNELTITFTDDSVDPDGTVVSWLWDFGDGNTSTDQNPVHTYSSVDTFNVTLTVSDNDNRLDSINQNVISETPSIPVASFFMPSEESGGDPNFTYTNGDDVFGYKEITSTGSTAGGARAGCGVGYNTGKRYIEFQFLVNPQESHVTFGLRDDSTGKSVMLHTQYNIGSPLSINDDYITLGSAANRVDFRGGMVVGIAMDFDDGRVGIHYGSSTESIGFDRPANNFASSKLVPYFAFWYAHTNPVTIKWNMEEGDMVNLPAGYKAWSDPTA